MRRSLALTGALALILVVVVGAQAAGPRKLFYEETLSNGASGAVAVTVRAPAAFRVVLRTSTQGRTRLFLSGANAPSGGPLIDTKTYACEGAAGSFSCKASYEALPKGTYTFRVRRDGPAAHVQLTLRW